MSKYQDLDRAAGNSKWFLQRTLAVHDKSMDHPWMKMIYNQHFSLRQYGTWLAMNRACFKALEEPRLLEMCKSVHKPHLERTRPLEADLHQLLAEEWLPEASQMASSSKATQKYLQRLEKDSANPNLVLAHHFLQYNAVLSGGAYIGEMVSQKLCIPHGAPGVQFYAFEGVKQNMGPAEVQRYLKDFNMVQFTDDDREKMLVTMNGVYADMEEMMQECYEINPQEGVAYGAAQASAPPPIIPEAEQLNLSLAELIKYKGEEDGRILMSLAGELLDISAGREMYGPDCGYAILAGHDVTKCLATMSLEPGDLDDLEWKPTGEEDQSALDNWREKLKAKYPVAGSLRRDPAGGAPEGLRQRGAVVAAPRPSTSEATPATASAAPAPAASASAASASTEKCPISGKEGVGCPMAMFTSGIKPKVKAAPKSEPAQSGFMAGKSMIAAVTESKQEESFIYKLCPLHWDDNTTRLLITVAAASWVSGIFVGWNLHRQWLQWTAS